MDYCGELEMCEFCDGKEAVKHHYGKFKIGKFIDQHVICCEMDKCPPYSNCSNRKMNLCVAMAIIYCPICGRKLVEE